MVRATKKNSQSHRQGFTLLELLIVVVIIALLAALIIPAVGRARVTARIAGVQSEINQLESAIAKFTADHGIEPPSSIYLWETGANWDSASAATIRQIWPQYSFGDFDINQDGSIATTAITLTGVECLTFFLGGVNTTNAPGNIGAFAGFSKDPTNPFSRGGSREAPLFEFQTGRVTDFDSDGFPEYVDSLPGQKNPYLYYSAYGGQGYNLAEFLNSTVSVPITPTIFYGLTMSYTQTLNATDLWKPNGHQIISPGFDGTVTVSPSPAVIPSNGAAPYGYGGAYVPKANPTLQVPTAPPPPPTPPQQPPPTAVQRISEADNITNFSTGTLQPQ